MVQSIDGSANKPIYNGVKINIKKPEVNVGEINAGINTNGYPNNGVYNAVNIEIDNPSVNAQSNRIYDYPEAEGLMTYEMLNPNSIPLPQGFNLAYHTTNVILPKMEQEIEVEDAEPEEIVNSEEVEIENTESKEIVSPEEVEEETPAVPEPNYTTTEAEKGVEVEEPIVKEEENENIVVSTTSPAEDEITQEIKDTMVDNVEITNSEVKPVEIKKPEIIPGEEILPDVDIPLVISNLTNADYDIQAQQMEEIARISLDNPENAIPYIVREVFSSLIDMTQNDTTNLEAPTDEQVMARKKLISNFIAMENAKQEQTQGEVKLPYQLTEKDLALANELSPMELAERNKEYALYTISILAKIYTDEIEKETGNIVPLTDLPGSAAIVDALRFNPNSGVKIAAIDALRHIQRPEYKEEMTTLYTLAQADSNPQVAMAAERALNS